MTGCNAGALVIEVFVARSTRWCVRFRSGGADIYNYYRTRAACLREAVAMLNGVARKKLPEPARKYPRFSAESKGIARKKLSEPARKKLGHSEESL
jgi:hypothetical protein